ncbi:MAG: hypothetical protein K9N49_06215 [Candidatus Marinimicrobia bacterium]|nr:hypothetical protein [Candidatus Neomarinimicrobiota bacterium]
MSPTAALCRLRYRWVAVFVFLAGAGMARAQWATQSLTLEPGWNAVYLDVQPEPRALDAIFTNRAIESVWKWDRRFSHIEFTVDPYTLEPEDPHWLVWLPPDDPRRFLARLFELQGAQAYLVRVATNAAPLNVALKGRVILPLPDWFPRGLTLVGLPVHPDNPPTFADFFKFTPEVDTTLGVQNQLFTINSQGRGVTIVQPHRDKIRAGRAYWIGCARDPRYMGPLHVAPSGGGAVDFGTTAVQQDLAMRNLYATRSLVVRVVQTASEAPAAGFTELAGPVPLSYLVRNASNQWEWLEFPAEGLEQTLGPGEDWTLKLGVRRQDFTPYTPTGTNGYAYQSILLIEDADQSLRVRAPVTAQKPAMLLGAPLDDHHENAGLWVGAAVLNKINAPAYTGTNLLATVAPLTMRLIIHVNAYGQARLLQQVVLAWDNSLTDPPHTNGTYALFVNDADVPTDTEEVHRISSVAFPLMAPVWLTGEFTNELTGTVSVGFDDPTNPTLHRFHPMHDNQNWDFEPYSNAVETLAISREITLAFEAPGTNLVQHPHWGVDNVMGAYRETLTGLRAQPVAVEGSFRLERISRINEIE